MYFEDLLVCTTNVCAVGGDDKAAVVIGKR
jgi:hypothetical protein